MASSSNLTSVIISDSHAETTKMQDITSLLQKEVSGENLNFRSISLPHNQQTISDGLLPSPLIEIPQWKKDLIQRRKTNVAKTITANQCFSVSANSSKAYKTSASSASSSPTSDFKNSLNFPNNNNICEKSSIHVSNVNTICDSKMNSSHHSFISALNVNNTSMYKTPATFQQDEIESSSGGHHTQVNNKPSGGSYNYSEKLSARTVSVIQQEQTQTVGLLSQLLSVVEQNSNESNSTLAQENVKFEKNLTEQHETTNTTSSDSVKTSTSRLGASLKVAAAAENYKKSNKGHLNVCVSEQATHILQETALTTSASNKNGNGGCGCGCGCDDEQQLHHQLKAEHESGSLVCADTNVKESDQNLLSINNNANGIITLSPKVVLNKKPCGITSTSVKSSPILSSSQFVKNQNIGNSTLVSSYHNHKINTKYRLNQNSGFSSNNFTTSSVIESPTTVTNNKKKMVAVQEMNEIGNNELDFDPSEELQYGPGIVSKLRCRYLSLALRQSVSKQRLSMDTFRRATSLNNLLDNSDVHDEDDEDDNSMQTRSKESTIPTLASISQIETKEMSIQSKEPTVSFEKNIKNYADERITSGPLAYSHHHRSRHVKRGNDSLKRARSVEALLCEKSPWNFAINQPVILSNNTESVSIEDKINNARDRLLSGTDNPPKRLTSIIDDTERPPPDLVKQTLKIFEASANRKGRTLNRNSGGEVATKIANYKSIITQNKPVITYPKPPISPKKTDLKKTPNEPTKISSLSPTTPTANQSTQIENNMLPVCSTPAVSSRTSAAFRQKMDLTPIKNVGCVGSDEGLSENSPDIIPRHKLLDKVLPTVAVIDSPVTELTKQIEKLRIESPVTIQTQNQAVHKEFENRLSVESSDRDSHDDDDDNDDADDDDDDDSIDGVYEVNKEECDSAKQISKCALEKIAKAGTSKRFQYQTKSSPLANGNSLVKLSDPLHDIPNLPSLSPTTIKQIGVIRPILAEPQHVDNSPFLEIVGENSIQVTPTLTSREIEKNRINNEKKIEVQGNYCSMDEVSCIGFAKGKKTISITTKSENNETVQTSAWSSAIINKKKRNPATSALENNTMVFNFKDRKEVPDYIDNDGLNFKRKRELPKPNESGFVLLGDLSLETSTDPEDEWPMCPPSPCDVEFENANIIIDGKSSIKNRPKDAHFRVQFNDTLTSTFEYPSESSVIEDSGSEYADDLSLNVLSASSSSALSKQTAHETDSSNIHHHHVIVEEIIQLPHSNKVLGNLSLGSAPLGSYTPVKATTENIFQLGVTRIPNSQTKKNSEQFSPKESLLGDYYKELENNSLEYLKPASDDLTIAYSEGSLKTDLLY